MIDKVIAEVVDEVEEEAEKRRKKINLPAAKGFAVENKTQGQKFVETFFGEDLNTIFKSWITDVVFESTKNFLADMFIGGIERLFYGRSYRTGGGYSNNIRRDYVSYDQAGRNRMAGGQSQVVDAPAKRKFTYNDVIMTNSAAAENLYAILNKAIREYGNVSVSEVFECLTRDDDQTPFTVDFTDNYIGWKKELPVNIRRINRNCYKLELPQPVNL